MYSHCNAKNASNVYIKDFIAGIGLPHFSHMDKNQSRPLESHWPYEESINVNRRKMARARHVVLPSSAKLFWS
jgi:hypothetical protein